MHSRNTLTVSSLSPLHPQPLHLLDQTRVVGQPELACRLRLVPVVAKKRGLDDLAFGLIDPFLQRPRLLIKRVARSDRAKNLGRNVVGVKLFFVQSYRDRAATAPSEKFLKGMPSRLQISAA
jgi:hypothetical protein